MLRCQSGIDQHVLGGARITGVASPITILPPPGNSLHLDKVGQHAESDGGGSALASWCHGRGSKTIGAGRGHRVFSGRSVRLHGGSSRSLGLSLRSSGGRVFVIIVAGGGRILLSTEVLDVVFAILLASCAAGVLVVALAEELLADEGGDGLAVVLKTRCRVVGAAVAGVFEGALGTELVIIWLVVEGAHT